MELRWYPATTPESDDWRIRGVVRVYTTYHDDRWVISAAVIPARRFAIVELHVVPAEHEMVKSDPRAPFGFRTLRMPSEENTRGRWSGHFGMPRDDIFSMPRDDIPSELLRAIRARDIRAAASEWVAAEGLRTGFSDAHWWRTVDALARHANQPDPPEPLTPTQKLARIAEQYVALLDDPDEMHRPNEVIAQTYGRTPGWASTQVYRARTHGLLEPQKPGRGKPSGHLTAKAQRILDALNPEPEDDR